MEFNKSVSNPMLVGSIELLKAEDTVEHCNMFLTELLKASLLAPALVDPAPQEDEEGNLKLLPDSKVQFLMLPVPDGRKYFMGFTDDAEYQLWVEKNRPCPVFALAFDDYIGMLMQKDAEGNPCPAQGIIINPFGSNLVVHKDMLAQVMAGRMIQALKQGDKKNAQKLRMPAPSNNTSPEAETAGGEDLDEKEEF